MRAKLAVHSRKRKKSLFKAAKGYRGGRSRLLRTVKDAVEKEVKTLDKRKFVAWTIDHQHYHILMQDAILDYIKMKYVQ